jgi:hypothetical protein
MIEGDGQYRQLLIPMGKYKQEIAHGICRQNGSSKVYVVVSFHV